MHDPRRDPDYLEDICEAMRRIAQYTAEMTYEGFLHETIVQDAVVRNLTLIGEATKRLSPDFRWVHPEPVAEHGRHARSADARLLWHQLGHRMGCRPRRGPSASASPVWTGITAPRTGG